MKTLSFTVSDGGTLLAASLAAEEWLDRRLEAEALGERERIRLELLAEADKHDDYRGDWLMGSALRDFARRLEPKP